MSETPHATGQEPSHEINPQDLFDAALELAVRLEPAHRAHCIARLINVAPADQRATLLMQTQQAFSEARASGLDAENEQELLLGVASYTLAPEFIEQIPESHKQYRNTLWASFAAHNQCPDMIPEGDEYRDVYFAELTFMHHNLSFAVQIKDNIERYKALCELRSAVRETDTPEMAALVDEEIWRTLHNPTSTDEIVAFANGLVEFAGGYRDLTFVKRLANATVRIEALHTFIEALPEKVDNALEEALKQQLLQEAAAEEAPPEIRILLYRLMALVAFKHLDYEIAEAIPDPVKAKDCIDMIAIYQAAVSGERQKVLDFDVRPQIRDHSLLNLFVHTELEPTDLALVQHIEDPGLRLLALSVIANKEDDPELKRMVFNLALETANPDSPCAANATEAIINVFEKEFSEAIALHLDTETVKTIAIEADDLTLLDMLPPDEERDAVFATALVALQKIELADNIDDPWTRFNALEALLQTLPR